MVHQSKSTHGAPAEAPRGLNDMSSPTWAGRGPSRTDFVELHGWNGVMQDGSRAAGHQAACRPVGSVALSASRLTMPACSLTSSGSPDFVLFVATRYDCTEADANYGSGWEDHFLAKPWPIHLIPADTSYHWIINGAADILALSWKWSDVQARYAELQSVPAATLDGLCRRGFEDALVRHLIERICSESDAGHPQGKLFVDSLFLSLLLALLGLRTPTGSVSPRRERLSPAQHRRVIEYMHAHLHEDIGLPQLADACGISAAHFSRAFKAMIGRSPYRFLLDLRVARAQQLLAMGTRTIADIAMETGFGDQSRFTKVFGQSVGMPPSAYRAARRDTRR